jgi:nicotinamide mononucleotide transporter
MKHGDIALSLSLFALYSLAVGWIFKASLSPVEMAGVASNIAAIILLKKENPRGFAVAVAANSILAAYFVLIGLSGQAINRTIYALMSAASLASWMLPQKNGRPLRPNFLRRRWYALLFAGLAAVVAAKAWTGAGAKGALDYASLYLSLCAGLLVMRKKVEAWYLWLMMDTVNLPLFVLAGAYLNVFYAAFSLFNDSAAAIRWRREAGAKPG